jgi:outer membrane murein-binding lipoprotein Lpp
MSRFLLVVVAVAVTLLSGCIDQRVLDAFGEAQTIDAHVVMDGPEALEWLKSNRNESALASNRFLGTENAVKYVKALYAAGAVKIVVPNDTIHDDKDTMSFEGGPYADALVVTVPTEAGKRQAVIAMCRAELRREGFDSDEVETAPQIYLWWD